ncbi:NUDIX hydrolase [Streptomyces sp. CAU 1734]|uniref:NUDIX hydrolase n=1 Tax=Streptomyces sp. CAU 1734 TaxID=3140360 RepID=UPI003261AD7A
MAVSGSDIVKELTAYIYHHPSESEQLMPLYHALRDHSVLGDCPHRGACPVVRAGALVVDEEERVLAFRDGAGWGLAESEPHGRDRTLHATALRALREHGGIREVWDVPGAEEPVVVEARREAGPDGARLSVGFRYLFRCHSRVVASGRAGSAELRWVPLAEIEERLAGRLRGWLVVRP